MQLVYQRFTESLADDDVSSIIVRKYEMDSENIKQDMPKEIILTSQYGVVTV